MEISIVIPTHNRAEILNESLKRIFSNNFPKNKYEVIVIDDGSTDNTKKVCLKWQKSENLTYIHQKKAGQGVARNKGIEQAKGKIIIFGQDDIFATKTFLEEHYKIHQKYPSKNYACLGLILWDPEINISELMNWSTNGSSIFKKFGGHQFAFEKLEDGKPANFNFFYTSNLSLKKEIFEKNLFDPWFDGYGWEDIELGYRLEKEENLKLIYNSSALAYHHHEISFEDFKKRMFQIGKSVHLLEGKHPELQKIPKGKKRIIFNIIGSKLFILVLKTVNQLFKNKLNPLYFYCLSKRYFMKGLNSNSN